MQCAISMATHVSVVWILSENPQAQHTRATAFALDRHTNTCLVVNIGRSSSWTVRLPSNLCFLTRSVGLAVAESQVILDLIERKATRHPVDGDFGLRTP